MSEWKKVKLGEISQTIQTGPFGSQLHQSDYSVIGIPVVMPKDIIAGNIEEASIARVEQHHIDRLSRHMISYGDILYARRGDVGKCAFTKQNQEGWLCGTGCLRVTINPDMANPKFVFFQLQKQETIGWITNHAIGSTMLNLNKTILSNAPVEIPSLRIQNRIVEILSRYDSLIENYQKQIKLLEEAAQRLYKEWFVDLHFPGHENTNIVDGVPEGWEKKKLCELFSFVRGKSYTSKELSDEGTIMVNLKNIQSFGGYKSDVEKHFIGTYKEEQTLMKGDLIMGVTDMTQERRLVGSVALIPDFKETATFSMDLIKLISFKLPNIYLYCAMRYGDVSRQIAPLANGVNVLHLKPEAISNIEMVVASDSIIEKFVSYTSKTIESILSLQSQLRLLTEARDRLLPKMMSGEIKIESLN